MTVERKRLTAVKVPIKSIVTGRYFQQEGFESNYLITPQGQKVSRVRVMATVMTKFISDDGNYGFLVLDDGTETIRAKAFQNTKIFSDIDVGDIVDLFGKVRVYADEVYITPEIIRKINDPNWLILRNLEIIKELKRIKELKNALERFEKETADLEEIKKLAKAEGLDPEEIEVIYESKNVEPETKEEDRKALKEEIKGLIDSLDDGSGAKYSDIIEKSSLPESVIEDVINELLSEGTCYEPRPGRIKRL
ncbi:MAG: hypothetical protein DRP11_02435 [Candidatus Aenigmatarchaeota archaeon]|nr:MAG: hypothetical protein DRP11_02435 [Candidatus Aenigmarchaeota archaeon]